MQFDEHRQHSFAGHNKHGIIYIQDGLFFGQSGNQIIIPEKQEEPTIDELKAIIEELREENEKLKQAEIEKTRPKRSVRKMEGE
jgi:hypothetical protein